MVGAEGAGGCRVVAEGGRKAGGWVHVCGGGGGGGCRLNCMQPLSTSKSTWYHRQVQAGVRSHTHWPHLNHGPLGLAIPSAAVRLHVAPSELQVKDSIVGLLIRGLCFSLTACIPPISLHSRWQETCNSNTPLCTTGLRGYC